MKCSPKSHGLFILHIQLGERQKRTSKKEGMALSTLLDHKQTDFLFCCQPSQFVTARHFLFVRGATLDTNTAVWQGESSTV